MKVYLFAYGSLRPLEDPPKTMRSYEKDAILADEIQIENLDKGQWAEVVIDGKKKYWVHGYTLVIDNSELIDLDLRESPEYFRIKMNTKNGHRAWVYIYDKNYG